MYHTHGLELCFAGYSLFENNKENMTMFVKYINIDIVFLAVLVCPISLKNAVCL